MSQEKRVALLLCCVFCASSATLQGVSAGVLSPYESAPTPLRHGVRRLSDYTGLAVGKASGKEPVIRIELNSTQNPKIGAQGYTIRSVSGNNIAILGNTDEGAANGVYSFRQRRRSYTS